MQTTSAPPESPNGARPTSASTRRPWRLIAIVVGLVVIAGAVA
jgi:hypothetical protein